MNAKEKAALSDFVATVVWPVRTVRAVTTPAGEQDFTLTAAWDTTHDTPMAWIDGNRVPWDEITWNSPTSIRLPSIVPFGRLVIILISPGSGAGYMPRDPNGVTFLGDVDVGGHRLTKLAPSEEPDDAVRRDEVVAIAQALVGANYALLTGAVFTGNVTVPPATEAGHAVRRDQVALLNGTQPFTAEQQGVAASNAAGLTTKQQVEAAIAAATSGLNPPNRLVSFTTPEIGATWTVPAGVTKVWIKMASASGAGGGAGPSAGGNGAPGRSVTFALTVTPGQVLTRTIGGRGYKGGASFAPVGAGGGGGGGGGQTSLTTTGVSVVCGGGGGGGGGGGNSGDPSGFIGVGGAGGTAGGTGTNGGAGVGGAAGSGGTANGGVGGTAGNAPGGTGSQGVATSSPAEILSTINEAWAFGDLDTIGDGPQGGSGGSIVSLGGDPVEYDIIPATDGQDGYLYIRYYQP